VTRLQAGQLGFYDSIASRGWEFFSSPLCPDWLWVPPSLLSNGYWELFPWVWGSKGMKLTTHHLVLRSRMRATVPPLPNVFMLWDFTFMCIASNTAPVKHKSTAIQSILKCYLLKETFMPLFHIFLNLSSLDFENHFLKLFLRFTDCFSYIHKWHMRCEDYLMIG
jgi:hypothetical protein